MSTNTSPADITTSSAADAVATEDETTVDASAAADAQSTVETPQQRAARLAAIGTGPAWVVTAIVLDAASILLFAFIGGRAHATDPSFLHVLEVAWPFLLAAVVGWGGVRAWRAPLSLSHTAAPVWLITLVGGVLLRGLTLHGVAFGFIVVTGIVLAVFLFGWRAIMRAAARRSAGWGR